MRPLSQCQVGDTVTIARIMGRGLAVRLGAMGLREGDRVKIVSRISRGPLIIENLRDGGRLALGWGMIHRIMVE